MNEDIDAYYDACSHVLAVPTGQFIEDMIHWDMVLGYEVRPWDIVCAIEKENKLPGPYSWNLACNIAKIARLRSGFCGHSLESEFDRWFYHTFECKIKNEKIQGVKPPKPKGFWSRFFG